METLLSFPSDICREYFLFSQNNFQEVDTVISPYPLAYGSFDAFPSVEDKLVVYFHLIHCRSQGYKG